jgi:hypothetical protein
LAARAEDEEEPGKEQGGAARQSSERTVQARRRRQGKKGESPNPGLGRGLRTAHAEENEEEPGKE